MKYIKTFEYLFIFGNNKKPDTWYDIEMSLNDIFGEIAEINKFSEYRKGEDREHTTQDIVQRHYDLTNKFKKYDFVVQIDGEYLFDIKNFMSKSYKQLINIDKSDRATFNQLMKFFNGYYKFQKMSHDSNQQPMIDLQDNFGMEADVPEYVSVFVEDPIFDTTNTMKKINESIITSTGIEYNHINLNNTILSNLTKFDISAIHDKGLRIYTISNTFELVEQTRADYIRKLIYKNNLHRHFKSLLIITEEYSETIKKYLLILKEMEEQKEKELELRFKTMIGISQRDVNIN
tara:strand:+ start:4381 stop:5250 length:870 start_codon:yes stop_codon:yes gene_type:complete